MRRMSITRRSSSPPPSPFAPESRPSIDFAREKLCNTPSGTKTRVRILRELFYKSRHNEEFCTELARENIVEPELLRTINSNENETERNWAAGVLENITELTPEGREKCYENGGVRVLMKRIFKEKNNTETRRSCVIALAATIKVNKEAKDSCVKFGGVKMFMDLLESYDTATGADIVLALSNLMQDLDDSVANEVAERGGCDQFVKKVELNAYRNDRLYSLKALTNLLPKVEASRNECIEKDLPSNLIDFVQNDDDEMDEIKLHAAECLLVLSSNNDDVKQLCKESFLLIFLDPLQENPQYYGSDVEEKAGKVKELVVLLGGEGKEMKRPDPNQGKITLAPAPKGKNAPAESITEDPFDEEAT